MTEWDDFNRMDEWANQSAPRSKERKTMTPTTDPLSPAARALLSRIAAAPARLHGSAFTAEAVGADDAALDALQGRGLVGRTASGRYWWLTAAGRAAVGTSG